MYAGLFLHLTRFKSNYMLLRKQFSQPSSFLSLLLLWTNIPFSDGHKPPHTPACPGHLSHRCQQPLRGMDSDWGAPTRFSCSHNHDQMLINVSSFPLGKTLFQYLGCLALSIIYIIPGCCLPCADLYFFSRRINHINRIKYNRFCHLQLSYWRDLLCHPL
jgi:hypothetical protein